VVISATSSDAGKTMVTSAILRILRDRGYRVQPFKVGPDYIDPMYLTKASGRACRNIDSWLMSREAIYYNLVSGCQGADLAVIEGVRGLYEGASPIRDVGSTAHVAKILSAPVILVVNCESLTRSVAAQVIGFKSMDRRLRIEGVILNKVRDEKHEEKIKRALRYYADVPVIGVLHRSPLLHVKKRHLGLLMPHEIEEVDEVIESAAKMLESSLDLDKLIEIMNSSPEIYSDFKLDAPSDGERIRIGVFMDAAFSFYYHENLEILRKMNAEIVPINSLSDRSLSNDIAGVLIGGGYPEVFAKELEENQSLRFSIKERACDGMPIVGECGGLMYLCEHVTYGGRTYKMAGVFDGAVYFSKRVVSYVRLKTKVDCPIAKKEDVLKGHEFHYSYIDNISAKFAFRVLRGKGIKDKMDGALEYETLGMFTHIHYLSCPDVPKNFLASCRRYLHR